MRRLGKVVPHLPLAFLALLLSAALTALPIYVHNRHGWAQIQRHQQALLYETDHKRLLSACRDLWRQHRQGDGWIAPGDGSVPPAITALRPHAIGRHSSGVSIELGGQGCHYGFDAFFADLPSDRTRVAWKDVCPSTQLSPELWYYAENGVIEPPHRP